jgi:biopolymer transport protein TolQ
MGVIAVLPFAAISRSVPSLFTDAGVFAKIILVTLFIISVIAWAIMWDRTRLYLRLRAKGNALRKSLATKGVPASMARLERFTPSVEASILAETRRYLGVRGVEGGDWRLVVDSAASEEVERAKMRDVLDRRALNEISEMERHLIFLSTTSSVAPFLGLLGTVWGIMSSFLSMGAEGAASIEVVGPGIAEALVTTIAGLAAAIPALVGYNLLVRQVHRKETAVDLYISRIIEHCVVARGGAAAGSPPTARETRSGASV